VYPVTRGSALHDPGDSPASDLEELGPCNPWNYIEGDTIEGTMDVGGSPKEVVDLVSDDYAWQILAETREDDRSAETLSETCDADPSTIYRRIERLEEAELLEAEQQLDPGGHHYKTYRANLDAIHVHLDEEGFTVEIDRREPPADRFTRLYEGFK
jgi:DNA-binding transcriptional ArsR family regulator